VAYAYDVTAIARNCVGSYTVNPFRKARVSPELFNNRFINSCDLHTNAENPSWAYIENRSPIIHSAVMSKLNLIMFGEALNSWQDGLQLLSAPQTLGLPALVQ
jgi:hypothetical protein